MKYAIMGIIQVSADQAEKIKEVLRQKLEESIRWKQRFDESVVSVIRDEQGNYVVSVEIRLLSKSSQTTNRNYLVEKIQTLGLHGSMILHDCFHDEAVFKPCRVTEVINL